MNNQHLIKREKKHEDNENEEEGEILSSEGYKDREEFYMRGTNKVSLGFTKDKTKESDDNDLQFKRPIARTKQSKEIDGRGAMKTQLPQLEQKNQGEKVQQENDVNIALIKKKVAYGMISLDIANGNRLVRLYHLIDDHFKQSKDINSLVGKLSKKELQSSLFFIMSLINEYDDIRNNNTQFQCNITNDVWVSNSIKQITENCKKRKEEKAKQERKEEKEQDKEMDQDKDKEPNTTNMILDKLALSALGFVIDNDDNELLNKKRQSSREELSTPNEIQNTPYNYNNNSSEDNKTAMHNKHQTEDNQITKVKIKKEKIRDDLIYPSQLQTNNTQSNNTNLPNPIYKPLPLNQIKKILKQDIVTRNILTMLIKCESSKNVSMIQKFLESKQLFIDYEESISPISVIVHETPYFKIKVSYSKSTSFTHSIVYHNIKTV